MDHFLSDFDPLGDMACWKEKKLEMIAELVVGWLGRKSETERTGHHLFNL